MTNSKRMCLQCKDRFRIEEGILTPGNKFFCCSEHLAAYAIPKQKKVREKAERKDLRERKQKLETRNELYQKLQKLVNQTITKVRDVGELCCTCNTTNIGAKFDAGHFLSVGSNPDLRFEPTNIHKQCSVKCNQHGSGMRNEYEKFIVSKYGQNHLDWLIGPHITLKERFPAHGDIRAEIANYRVKLKDAGVKPCV
jgi:hypothetical protein